MEDRKMTAAELAEVRRLHSLDVAQQKKDRDDLAEMHRRTDEQERQADERRKDGR